MERDARRVRISVVLKRKGLPDFHNAAHLFEQQGNCRSDQEIKNILEILSRDHSEKIQARREYCQENLP